MLRLRTKEDNWRMTADNFSISRYQDITANVFSKAEQVCVCHCHCVIIQTDVRGFHPEVKGQSAVACLPYVIKLLSV